MKLQTFPAPNSHSARNANTRFSAEQNNEKPERLQTESGEKRKRNKCSNKRSGIGNFLSPELPFKGRKSTPPLQMRKAGIIDTFQIKETTASPLRLPHCLPHGKVAGKLRSALRRCDSMTIIGAAPRNQNHASGKKVTTTG